MWCSFGKYFFPFTPYHVMISPIYTVPELSKAILYKYHLNGKASCELGRIIIITSYYIDEDTEVLRGQVIRLGVECSLEARCHNSEPRTVFNAGEDHRAWWLHAWVSQKVRSPVWIWSLSLQLMLYDLRKITSSCWTSVYSFSNYTCKIKICLPLLFSSAFFNYKLRLQTYFKTLLWELNNTCERSWHSA